jgi:hydroxyacylglutathione hydrolase
MNKAGYTSIEEVIKNGCNMLTPDQFEKASDTTEAVILDVRHQTDFVQGFVPRSIFIGLKGGFAPWVGTLLVDVKTPILLIVDEGKEEEALIRLSRVGFDNVIGILDGGIKGWSEAGKELDTIKTTSAEGLEKEMKEDSELAVFDVRKSEEFTAEHIKEAKHTALDSLNDHLEEYPSEGEFYIHCAGGYRSVIAHSILKAHGIHNGIDVLGGYGAIAKTGIPITEYVCPSTLK